LPYTTLFRSLRDELRRRAYFQESRPAGAAGCGDGRDLRGRQSHDRPPAYVRLRGTGPRRFRKAGELLRAPGFALDRPVPRMGNGRSEEHTSELQSRENLVCRLLLEKKNQNK